MKTQLHSLILAGLLGLSGCIAHAHAHMVADPVVPHFVFAEPPMLVAIHPGVWVVHDYHAQVFFVGDAYWHVSGGIWYRADYYNGDWVAVSVVSVPIRIRHIDERRYVWFEGEAEAQRKQAPPKHAAAKHGGPPGQRDEPGLRLGHAKKASSHDDEPGHSQAAPGHGGGGPGHSGKAQDHAKPGKAKGKGKGPRA